MRVHRILGILAGISIVGPGLAGGAALVGISLAASAALGFCRTTTCAVENAPPACARDANGCLGSGIPLYWTERCISFSVGQNGSPKLGLDYAAAESLVEQGFDLWPNAVCSGGAPSIAVMSRGPLICDQREYNPTGPNANAVLFRDTGWEYDGSVIALTSVVFNSKTGQILGADMEINSGDYALSQINIQYVVGHESGHFFGLDHSPQLNALMYYQYGLDRVSPPALTPDDTAAICAAYPPGRMTPACNDFEPPGGFALDCGGNVVGSCAVAPGRPSGGRSAAEGAALLILAAAMHRWRAQRRRSA